MSTARVVHYLRAPDVIRTICGKERVKYSRRREMSVSNDPSSVTCKRCVTAMTVSGIIKRHKLKYLDTAQDHAVESGLASGYDREGVWHEKDEA